MPSIFAALDHNLPRFTGEESLEKKEGGTEYSQHLYGMAADIHCNGVEPKKMAEIARKIMPNFGGVGVYDWGIHVDTREEKADWNG